MNTKSWPSRYRNCMSRRSTMARPTATPALKVRSTTPPVRRLRSLVRTNAPPFPGFTCWNSMTWNRVPSRSSVMPRFRSLVLTLMASPPPSQDHEVLARPRQDPAPGGGDLDHVLDADAADAFEVDPGLDRDHRPLEQRLVAAHPQPGVLVDLQAHAVAGPLPVPLPE